MSSLFLPTVYVTGFNSLLPQHLPLPEVPGGVDLSSAGRLCARVQVRVPLALLALHPKCLRLFQIPGTGKNLLSSLPNAQLHMDLNSAFV